jgi:hypothetical protein
MNFIVFLTPTQRKLELIKEKEIRSLNKANTYNALSDPQAK